MSRSKYLTKSRFKLGIECPAKLFYTGKKEYANNKMDDDFLAALAQGGFQVGELAKLYYPGGHEVETSDNEEALSQTSKLLEQENIIIYEPAILFKGLFTKIDILVKKGNHFDLIEVKAKSFDSREKGNEKGSFVKKKEEAGLYEKWKPYLYDVAFQKYVLSGAYPDAEISAYLMMADKSVECSVDGLNQKFKSTKDESGRTGIKVSKNLTKKDLEDKILTCVPVDKEIDLIYSGKDIKIKEGEEYKRVDFFDNVKLLEKGYRLDEKLSSGIGSKCKKCEFKCSDDSSELKNGFKECWSAKLGWKEEDFLEPNILELWDCRNIDTLIAEEKIKLADLSEFDLLSKKDKEKGVPRLDKKPGITTAQRKCLQLEIVQNKQEEAFFDFEGIKLEMDKWVFPLHFIDFETSAVAIPFYKGLRPYEGVAFQFSHHILYEDGKVEHKGEYLNTEQGFFPNYEFIRKLKDQLDKDSGTIFKYSPHENTYLNKIHRQLMADKSEVPDKEKLCKFIESITNLKENKVEVRAGDRDMVDLWVLVKRHYYDPAMKGSNSIKAVLPAILNSSKYLQEKYSKPIYGSEIKSHNFSNWKWVELKNGQVVDPYKKLPKIFEDISDKDYNSLEQVENIEGVEEEELANGGAALTAYGRIQFSEITEYEKKEISLALLKYCELDTLAMVMIYEGWREMIKEKLESVK